MFLTIRDKAPLLAHINFNSSLKPSSQGREMDRRWTRVQNVEDALDAAGPGGDNAGARRDDQIHCSNKYAQL